MDNKTNAAAKIIKALSRASLNRLLEAEESNERGNGGSTIRFEILGERLNWRAAESCIDAGFLLPRVAVRR